MIVLICGSRTWDDRGTMVRYMIPLTKTHGASSLTLIHGDARGADRMAADIATSLGWGTIIAEPADWTKYGRRAGYVRNKKMLTYKPDLVMAFRSSGESKGTDMMVDLARSADVETEVYYAHDYSTSIS